MNVSCMIDKNDMEMWDAISPQGLNIPDERHLQVPFHAGRNS